MTNRGASPPPNQDRRAAIIYGAMAVVALIGLADSVYLAVEHDAGRIVRCTLLPGCADVLGSRYASVRGVPLALIGAIAYFVVFSLAILSAFGYRVTRQLLRLLVAGMLLTSLWLLYLQAFVLKAFCEHCLLSAAVTLGLSILALISRWRGRDDQTP